MNENSIEIKVCPVCGREYVPAPQHVYRIKYGKALVCSYSCMRATEKAKGKKEGAH